MSIDDQVNRELPWLRRLARKLASEDADDLVQETLLLAHRDQPRPHPTGGLRPWLAQAMRNRRFSLLRSKISREHREQQPEPDTGTNVPEQRLIEADVIRILDEALATLNAEERELLRDRFFGDRSAAEIARELGVPTGTVRTRIRRSLGRLRGVLDERHGNDRSRWASAMVAVPVVETPGKWIAGVSMATATKGLVIVGALTGLAALGWVFVDGSGGEQDTPAAVATQASEDERPVERSTVTDRRGDEATRRRPHAGELARARKRWEHDLAAIEAAKPEGVRAAPDSGEKEDEGESYGNWRPPADMVAQLAELACLDLLPDHPRGRLALEIHYVGDPSVGTIVESIDVVEDSMNAPELRECWTESMYMLEMEAPSEPVRGTHKLEYNAGEGDEVDQLLGLLKLYLKDHPEIGDEYPAIGRVAELPDDAPMSQWMTPEFMKTMGENPELNAELNAYFTGKLGDRSGPESEAPPPK